uniref:Uncharacterized protein n=1 Tax=Myotis myotis TaxID=51298 RepID=A0A7J7Z6F1_MYOMY|nr:hypothetical protein mMyoMyo1_014066 [Myotis myotis]
MCLCHRRKTPDPARHRMPRPLRHSYSPCSRPCRDPAGAPPSRFSPKAEDGSLLRFGRNTQGSGSNNRLITRAGEGLSTPFWSLAAPQRFGKK